MDLNQIYTAVLCGDLKLAVDTTRTAVEEGVSPNDIINLRADFPCERFLSVAREEKADIICLSALLTTTMERMKEIIDAVHCSDLNGKVKVMIGGAPSAGSTPNPSMQIPIPTTPTELLP